MVSLLTIKICSLKDLIATCMVTPKISDRPIILLYRRWKYCISNFLEGEGHPSNYSIKTNFYADIF